MLTRTFVRPAAVLGAAGVLVLSWPVSVAVADVTATAPSAPPVVQTTVYPWEEPVEIVTEGPGFLDRTPCPEEDPESCPPMSQEPSATGAPSEPAATTAAVVVPASSTPGPVGTTAPADVFPTTVGHLQRTGHEGATEPTLARTGLDAWWFFAAGVLLLGAGGACFALVRR